MLVATLVIALSVLFGAHRSLTAAKADVEAAFYQGTDGSGYSIQTDLNDCMAITQNLWVVAERYLEKGDPAIEELDSAVQSLDRADSPGQKYEDSRSLLKGAETVMARLDGLRLSEKDASYIQGFRADLNAKKDTMSRNGYNALVDDFNKKVLGMFPANLLKKVVFVSPAEAFR